MAESTKIEYPANINVDGIMSFPIYSKEQIPMVEAWRTRKGFAKPKYADRISFALLLNEKQTEDVVKGLAEYLTFAATLQEVSGGKKGIDPELVAKLQALVEKRDWSEKNLPLRKLSAKDLENADKNDIGDVVTKIKVAGPVGEAPFTRKALIKVDGTPTVVSLSEVEERLGDQTDPNALWWGASWPFRTNVRFNAFDAANYGVTAYGKSAYLLADKELKSFGGGGDAEVVDGGDWDDE